MAEESAWISGDTWDTGIFSKVQIVQGYTLNSCCCGGERPLLAAIRTQRNACDAVRGISNPFPDSRTG
jgi:iron-sulfur cluster repair protein YtfE (RIC family)